MGITIDEIEVADPVTAWAQAGFNVDADGVCRVGRVRIRLAGRDRGSGIIGWSLRHTDATDIDGIPTRTSTTDLASPAEHPNGVIEIDHLVLMSAHLRRTVDVLSDAGLAPRRERDTELGGRAIRQVFYRLGEVILEVVGEPDGTADAPSSLWGITFTVADIDATAGLFGDRTSRVKDAVQPGRRISTLRHQAFGMSVRTAVISGA
ncbi:VOC family protein [Mycobacterium sp. NPDC003323]